MRAGTLRLATVAHESRQLLTRAGTSLEGPFLTRAGQLLTSTVGSHEGLFLTRDVETHGTGSRFCSWPSVDSPEDRWSMLHQLPDDLPARGEIQTTWTTSRSCYRDPRGNESRISIADRSRWSRLRALVDLESSQCSRDFLMILSSWTMSDAGSCREICIICRIVASESLEVETLSS